MRAEFLLWWATLQVWERWAVVVIIVGIVFILTKRRD